MSSVEAERVALFVLRMSLGLFLLTWSIGKLIDSGHAIRIFSHFYGLRISPDLAIGVGAAEAGLSLLILVAAWKRFSYGLGLLVHSVSVVASARTLRDPFPHPNDLFVAGIPVLAAFFLLYLLRDRDVSWAVGH